MAASHPTTQWLVHCWWRTVPLSDWSIAEGDLWSSSSSRGGLSLLHFCQTQPGLHCPYSPGSLPRFFLPVSNCFTYYYCCIESERSQVTNLHNEIYLIAPKRSFLISGSTDKTSLNALKIRCRIHVTKKEVKCTENEVFLCLLLECLTLSWSVILGCNTHNLPPEGVTGWSFQTSVH